MDFRRSNLGFFVLEGFFWASYCTIFGFTVTILREYGFSAAVCGTVTTLQCAVIMFIQPLYGYLVDNVTTPKKGFIGVMAVGTLAAVPLPWIFRMGAVVVVLYMTFISMFVYSAGSMVDAWAVGVINKTKGMDYATVRGGGSIFYAIMALMAGNLIAPFGVQSLFILHVVLGGITVLVACFLADPSGLESTRGPHISTAVQVSFGKAVSVLLHNRKYVVFTACMCLFNFATRASNTYLPMVIENVGGNSGHFGIALFLTAMGEVVFMLLASRLIIRGIPPQYIYITALGILVFRYVLMATVDNLWVLLATQVVQAAGFGFNLRINAEYLVNVAPEGYQGMAIMLSGAISNGVGCVLGNYLGGELIATLGIRPYVWVCTVVMAGSMLVFLPTVLREHRQRVAARNRYLLGE
ncbi:MAG: MFS transporter [Angelakisella sp.]